MSPNVAKNRIYPEQIEPIQICHSTSKGVELSYMVEGPTEGLCRNPVFAFCTIKDPHNRNLSVRMGSSATGKHSPGQRSLQEAALHVNILELRAV